MPQKKVEVNSVLAFQKRLISEFEKHGDTAKVAKSLGISRTRLSQLIKKCGLKIVRRVEYVYTPTERANMRHVRPNVTETA